MSSITEQSLDLWRFARLENLWRDVIYGARSIARSRSLLLTALLSFGLGIGVQRRRLLARRRAAPSVSPALRYVVVVWYRYALAATAMRRRSSLRRA
jgi:hypothetical protein